MSLDIAATGASLTAAIVAATEAISTAGVLQEASPKVLRPVRDALAEAIAEFDAAAAAIEPSLVSDTVGGVDTATPVPLLWGILAAQAAASEAEAAIITARGYLGRAKVNVDREPS